jgi:hypothetical protein
VRARRSQVSVVRRGLFQTFNPLPKRSSRPADARYTERHRNHDGPRRARSESPASPGQISIRPHTSDQNAATRTLRSRRSFGADVYHRLAWRCLGQGPGASFVPSWRGSLPMMQNECHELPGRSGAPGFLSSFHCDKRMHTSLLQHQERPRVIRAGCPWQPAYG